MNNSPAVTTCSSRSDVKPMQWRRNVSNLTSEADVEATVTESSPA